MTPYLSFTIFNYASISNSIDKCLNPNAKITYVAFNTVSPRYIYVFRPVKEYRWFGWSRYGEYFGEPYQEPYFKEKVSICSINVEKEDVLCTEEEIRAINEQCRKKLSIPKTLKVHFLRALATRLCKYYG